MKLNGEWAAPKDLAALTDIEFILKNGEHVMISWESGTFSKREFVCSGVSTTDEEGRVTTGNLNFLMENLDSIDRIHYLGDSAPGSHIKSVTFVDQVAHSYKSQVWTFVNGHYIR